jgi:signal peptidase I
MRASALDRRVRKEARLLVRQARAAIGGVKPEGASGEAASSRMTPEREALGDAVREVEAGLVAGDLGRVRRGLPRLDELVDRLPRARGSVTLEYAWAIGSLCVLVLAIRAFVVEPFKIPSSSMLPTLEINDYIFVSKFVYGLRVPLVDGKLLARSPDRGEVIVFIQPCKNTDFIKRVIGLAGDRIEVRCNVVHVNGRAVPSAHVAGETCKISDAPGPSSTRECARYREALGGYTYDTYYEPDRPERDAAPRVMGDAGPGDFPQLELVRRCPAATNQRPGQLVRTRPVDAAGPCGLHLHYVVPEGHVFVMGDYRDGSDDSRGWGSVPIENIKGKALLRWLSFRELSWSGMRWSRMGDFVH